MCHSNECSYVALLCGERSDADSGRVGLDDPVNRPNVLRGHAQTGAHTAHCAIGRGHKRVRPCKGTNTNTSLNITGLHLSVNSSHVTLPPEPSGSFL